jgi:hypothetical protein
MIIRQNAKVAIHEYCMRPIPVANMVIWALVGSLGARSCFAQHVATTGYVTGDRLLTQCAGGPSTGDGLCLGYILGVVDAMQAAQASGGTLVFGWQTCPPFDVKAERLQTAVIHFLDDHPEARASSASGLVAKALSDTFPCSRNR